MAGDQQAAAIGQGCFTPGALKSTYGSTGCFVIINTGDEAVTSKNRLFNHDLLSPRRPDHLCAGGPRSLYLVPLCNGFETGIKLIHAASEAESIASIMDSNKGVYMVPALTGLGAPHWSPNARGAIYGITRDTSPADFVRAALNQLRTRQTICSTQLPVTVYRYR